MQTITEREEKRAATLSYLSQQPPADHSSTPKRHLHRLGLSVGVLSLAVVAFIYYPPEIGRWVGNSAKAEQTYSPGDKKSTEQPSTSHVSASAREIAGSGTIVATRTTNVFSRYEGQIIGVSVEPGEVVKRGQVLLILDDPSARFALEMATSNKVAVELTLAARVIDLKQARLSLERHEALAAHQASSRQQLEDARMTAELAANAVAQARQALVQSELSVRIAEEAIHELTVRAPFGGTITRLDARVGDTVLARVDSIRESQSLLTITDMRSLVIDADVAETSIAPLNAGAFGQAVLDAFPDHPFDIEVLRLAPTASAEKGTVTLRLAIGALPEGTRPNMAARIRIPLDNAGETRQ